jgi:tetratricopeptide (TPR) repeat protein
MKGDTTMPARLLVAALAVALAAAGPGSARAQDHGATPSPDGAREPLIATLGPHTRVVSTRNRLAQRYFDQGLNQWFGYDLEGAQRAFEEVTRLDPDCAMGWWGVALSLGPHFNRPAEPDRTVAAHRAAQAAIRRAVGATPVERALIEAIVLRYAEPAPTDAAAQLALDQAFADAMREVVQRYPADADARSVCAEAMMDLRPWDLWTVDQKMNPGTEEIIALLEEGLRRSPNHPGLNHQYIHAVEPSPNPERALASALRLQRLHSGVGHLTHMPAHVFERLGRYAESIEANRLARERDEEYVAAMNPQGFIQMYMTHNPHFLSRTALMEGRSDLALRYARTAVSVLSVETLRAMPGMDFFHAAPYFRHVRFGKWDDMLAEPAPPADLRFLKGMWHYGRGAALAARGDAAAAGVERDSLRAIEAGTTTEALQNIHSARMLLRLASTVLDGTLAERAGRADEAIERFGAAVACEDSLKYDEPPPWFYPVRHHLGQVLLDAGRAGEAEAVYRADLVRHPNNGWSLLGLTMSLEQQGKAAEAGATRKRFEAAWKRAEVPIAATRF